MFLPLRHQNKETQRGLEAPFFSPVKMYGDGA
jgi:hypothetical protein